MGVIHLEDSVGDRVLFTVDASVELYCFFFPEA